MSMKAFAKQLALAAACRTGVHRLASARFAGAGVIFAAHRVVEPGQVVIDASQAISTQFLSRCLEHVRRRGYQVLDLDQVHERLAGNRPGTRFVCFTFDDGYRDNVTLGLPIFERYGVPMTIFVATGFPDRRIFYRWRGLEHLVLQQQTIELIIGDRSQRLQARTIDEKRAAYRELARLAQQRPEIARVLLSSYGIDSDRLLQDTLSWAELATLAKHPLVAIGAHGVTHTALSGLDLASARGEMEGSRARLEFMLRKPIYHFAFPFGACGEREFALARELGFKTAVTSVMCNVFHDDGRELWSLPRLPLDSTVERLSTIDLHLSGMTGALTMRLNHPAIVRRARQLREGLLGRMPLPRHPDIPCTEDAVISPRPVSGGQVAGRSPRWPWRARPHRAGYGLLLCKRHKPRRRSRRDQFGKRGAPAVFTESPQE